MRYFDVEQRQRVTDPIKAALAPAVAVMAMTVAVSPAEAATTEHDSARQPAQPTLLKPEQLPGYRIKVSPGIRRLLQASTVKLYEQYVPVADAQKGGPATEPSGECTAVKGSYKGQIYVSTAAHCYDEITANKNGIIGSGDFYPSAPAIDFFSRANETYTIRDPQEYVQKRQALATVSGISINTMMTDWALLKVTPNDQPDPKLGPAKRSYDQIKAMPLDTTTDELLPGQEVALYGLPGINLDKPISTTGRYLGKVTNSYQAPDGSVRFSRADVVGINPQRPYEDSCYYGASGSHFVAEVKHQAVTSGPLSLRVNSLYDPYLQPDYSAPNDKARITNRIVSSEAQRGIIETQLHVDTRRFSTLCEFTIKSKNVLNAMIKGFGNYLPNPVFEGKGGGK